MLKFRLDSPSSDLRPTPDLLGLPPEVRHHILRYLLDANINHRITQLPLFEEYRGYFGRSVGAVGLDRPDSRDLGQRKGACNLDVGVLRACQLLNREGLHVLLHENHFTAFFGPVEEKFGLTSLKKRLTARGIVTWHPDWQWDLVENGFKSPVGVIRPTLTILYESPHSPDTSPLLVRAADLTSLACEIYKLEQSKLLDNTKEPPRFRLYFKSFPEKQSLSCPIQVTVKEFLNKNLFLWLGQFTISIHVGVESGFNTERAALRRQVEDNWRSFMLDWYKMDLPKRIDAMHRVLLDDAEEIRSAVSKGDTAHAFIIFQNLGNKIFCLTTRGPVPSVVSRLKHRRPMTIYCLICFTLAMQDDPAGFFETQKAFWQWALLHIQYAERAFRDSPEWAARTCLRKSELKIRLGDPFYRDLVGELAYAVAELAPGEVLTSDTTSERRFQARQWAYKILEQGMFSVSPEDPQSSTKMLEEIEKWKSLVHLRWGPEPDFSLEEVEKWEPWRW